MEADNSDIELIEDSDIKHESPSLSSDTGHKKLTRSPHKYLLRRKAFLVAKQNLEPSSRQLRKGRKLIPSPVIDDKVKLTSNNNAGHTKNASPDYSPFSDPFINLGLMNHQELSSPQSFFSPSYDPSFDDLDDIDSFSYFNSSPISTTNQTPLTSAVEYEKIANAVYSANSIDGLSPLSTFNTAVTHLANLTLLPDKSSHSSSRKHHTHSHLSSNKKRSGVSSLSLLKPLSLHSAGIKREPQRNLHPTISQSQSKGRTLSRNRNTKTTSSKSSSIRKTHVKSLSPTTISSQTSKLARNTRRSSKQLRDDT